MQLYQIDSLSQQALTIEGLCILIEKEYHFQIMDSGKKIKEYLLLHSDISDLTAPVSELLHLLFAKLDDEMNHLFRKESALIFPQIRKKYIGNQKRQDAQSIGLDTIESVRSTQSVISSLIQRIRQLLNNYLIQPHWNQDWKNCVNELFVLENKIFQWMHVEQNLLFPKLVESETGFIQ